MVYIKPIELYKDTKETIDKYLGIMARVDFLTEFDLEEAMEGVEFWALYIDGEMAAGAVIKYLPDWEIDMYDLPQNTIEVELLASIHKGAGAILLDHINLKGPLCISPINEPVRKYYEYLGFRKVPLAKKLLIRESIL